jgi:hypothetical protein
MSSSCRRRFRLRSIMATCAPMPSAILAALVPTTPPPMITQLAGATPGTPPSSTPRPPLGASRYCAPTCTAMRPATSLMGVSSGSEPSASWMVSYATPLTLASSMRLVNSGSGARCRYVNRIRPGRKCRIRRLRLFHLDHQVGAPPDFRRRGQNVAPASVLAVGERAAGARGGLDQNLVARPRAAPSRRWAPGLRVSHDL